MVTQCCAVLVSMLASKAVDHGFGASNRENIRLKLRYVTDSVLS